ncbi:MULTISPECIES: penicillin acylase family protein [Salipiger]|uniref:penicillin acylase family protein n=1 Tax=Salipiger TaxID=263377 RepID=UPI003518F659
MSAPSELAQTLHYGEGFRGGQVTWCVTHAMANIQDLFIERFEEAGRRYLHKGTWHDTEIQADTIHVRGQDAPEQVTIHRAKRIAARLDTIEPLSIETMSPIMMDQSSAAVHLFRDHFSRHEPQSGETAALCQQLLDWDGVMEKAAIGGRQRHRLRGRHRYARSSAAHWWMTRSN